MLTHFQITDRDRIAWVKFDQQNSKVNKWNAETLIELEQVIEQLKNSKFKAAVFISAKPNIFIAGADIDEIRNLKTSQQFAQAVTVGQRIFNLLEDLPIVTVAAIHGAAAGGRSAARLAGADAGPVRRHGAGRARGLEGDLHLHRARPVGGQREGLRRAAQRRRVRRGARSTS